MSIVQGVLIYGLPDFGVRFATFLEGQLEVSLNWLKQHISDIRNLAFGLLIDGFGFLAAVAALVVLARLAGRNQSLGETAVLAVGLALLGAGIFVWGLGLPLPLLPR